MASIKRKASVSIDECVACGTCVKVCPRKALSIFRGMYSVVNTDLCIGCGKCAKACPGTVITLREIVNV